MAFGGDVVADGRFLDLTHDLNLLAALGVRLVLVHGARPQIEGKLKERRRRSRFHLGLRVTDDAALACAKEANGRLRIEIPGAPPIEADLPAGELPPIGALVTVSFDPAIARMPARIGPMHGVQPNANASPTTNAPSRPRGLRST